MNRRSFLLGMGLMACSSGATTGTIPTKKPKGTRNPPPRDGGIVDATWSASQRRANRLAFHGDVLIHSVGDELRSWNAATMQRTETWTLPHRHFCIVQDGTLLAFGWPAKATVPVIHRIAGGKVATLQAPILPMSGSNVLLPAKTADRVYVTIQEDVYLLHLAGSSVEIEATLDHPAPNAGSRDQWISRGDGRLVGVDREGGFHVLGQNTDSAYPTPDRIVAHLAAASRDRLWYSYAELAEDWNAHTIVLAAVEKPMTAERTIDLAPGRVVHMASFGDMLVALIVTAQSSTDRRWNVALFDETGQERWRVDAPEAFGKGGALTNAFVAVGEHRVALASHDGKLAAWDVATGKVVG